VSRTARSVDSGLLQQLSDELMRLGRRRTTTYAGAELDTSAFRILWLLSEGPARTLKELAEELQLEQSTVSRQVSAAIRHGLVERCANVEGAGWAHRPTETGRRAYEHDAQLRVEVYSRVLDDLGRARVDALVAELAAFNDALDRAHQK
jgi:DNA-binding MarR family transcriptional regulator